MGRPRKKIDERQLLELAAMGCTMEEMAAVLGCNRDTLHDRFSAVIEEGRLCGNMSLRKAQQARAIKYRSDRMLIWLGINRLGQTGRMEHTGADGGPIREVFELRDAESWKHYNRLLAGGAPTADRPIDAGGNGSPH